jgi:hypothetical protein
VETVISSFSSHASSSTKEGKPIQQHHQIKPNQTKPILFYKKGTTINKARDTHGWLLLLNITHLFISISLIIIINN